MQAELSADAPEETRLAIARRNATLQREAFGNSRGQAARGRLIDSLVALADECLAVGDEAAASAVLGEAAGLLPEKLPADGEWRGRSVMLHRSTAGLAQKQGRHAVAVTAFEAALSILPADIARAGRDANAARLQLLVHLARSRLALGQARKVIADMSRAEKVMAALDGALPSRAIETVRAAVLANAGAGLAALEQMDAAEMKFAASIAAIDTLANPELAGFRTQVLNGWAGALRSAGREADATAMLSAFSSPWRANPSLHVHDANCGHDHGQGHAHGHVHHDHHEHDADCGCGSH